MFSFAPLTHLMGGTPNIFELLLEIAKKMAKEIPGGIILDQYNNIQNPLAHYYSTFGEIQVSSPMSFRTCSPSNRIMTFPLLPFHALLY
jgi:hypothetical protein